MAVLDERSEPLAKSARAGEQIDNAESGRQIRLLTNFSQPVYTGFKYEDQGGCDRYRGPADPFPDDVGNQGKEHQARAGSQAGIARARFPLPVFIPARFKVVRTLSFRSTAPWSSCTVVSGTDTKGAATRPSRRPGRSSGGRSSMRTSHGTAPFAQDSLKTGGAWRRYGSAPCGSRNRWKPRRKACRSGCEQKNLRSRLATTTHVDSELTALRYSQARAWSRMTA